MGYFFQFPQNFIYFLFHSIAGSVCDCTDYIVLKEILIFQLCELGLIRYTYLQWKLTAFSAENQTDWIKY